ncbi:MAG: 1-acyl-sn-glycerol-3-phosphate acyltransferase [Lachnospiraceae bacterium]|nr:1-acyl-sn-glycerol-3-phosphate acyltransferase [Lachnospiraceae bacterium]
MIRFIIAILFVVLALILSMPVYLVLLLIGLYSPETKEKVSMYFLHVSFRIIVFIAGTKVKFIGESNIPKDRAVLYVGNHRSYFDVIIPGTKLSYPSTFVAKKEFNRIPLLNLWMKNIHCLMLDRSDVKEGLKMVLKAIEYIKEGRSVFVFPEGTRNRTEDLLLPFKEGAMKISTKSGCPIIPVAITNSADVFEAHFPKLKKTEVVVHYGNPIYPDTLNKEELRFIGNKVASAIESMLRDDAALIG